MKRFPAAVAAAFLTGLNARAPAEEGGTRLTDSEGFVCEKKEDGTAAIAAYTGNEKNQVMLETGGAPVNRAASTLPSQGDDPSGRGQNTGRLNGCEQKKRQLPASCAENYCQACRLKYEYAK